MNVIQSRFLVTGLLMALTLVSGVWLSSLGKPINVVVFTLHKLIALATTGFTVFTVYHLLKGIEMRTILVSGAIAFTGLLFLALFVSGALLSLGKPLNAVILVVHRAVPLLAAASTAAVLYVLTRS